MNRTKDNDDKNILSINNNNTFRGDSLDTPNIILFNFKDYYRDIYDSIKIQRSDNDMDGIW